MDFEIDKELCPARRSLVGLRFADADEFERARRLIGPDPAFYHELYPSWFMIVVRRTAAKRFAAAGLRFSEVDQVEDEELAPEEVTRRDRALIEAWRPVVLQRLREQP